MFKRFLSTTTLIITGVVVIIALIGGVTYVAWRIINQTFQEQIQAAELQLLTSLGQQGQASMSNLEANINTLAVQEDIRATSATKEDEALTLLERRATNRDLAGSIISITRFDFRGNPVYAWPEDYNEKIKGADDPIESYPFAIPENLLELTRRGQSAVSEIRTELSKVPLRGGGTTTVLIAPVSSVNLRTEYLVYELDLSLYFGNLYGFVELGESGQLWVLDSNAYPQYEARDTYDHRTSIPPNYSNPRLQAQRTAAIDSYVAPDGQRQFAFISFRGINLTYIVIITRLESEAQAGIIENVVSIFAFSVVAVIFVIGVGSLFGQQIRRANQERQHEVQRRQTARILLEVSRALNSSLDLPTVLNRILEELQRLVPHDTASILLLEEDKLRVAAVQGFDGTQVGATFSMDQAKAARTVILNGEPLVINDTSKDERWTETIEGQRLASWMGLPLKVREKLVGVLNVNSFSTDNFSPDDTELAEGFADQASVAIQNAQFHELQIQQYAQELTIARGIQASLLPQEAPQIPMLEFASHSLPASQVSGDYFQYLPMLDGKITIAIGDVQGKGIPAALMMAVITTAIRDEAVRFPKPDELLQSLNGRLIDRMRQNQMNTALIVATYDPRTREFNVANGGMVQPYLRKPNETTFESISVGGYPLGVSETIRYNAKSVAFETGSMMVLVSDGVVEAQNPDGEFFGFERVEELLNGFPADITAEEVKQSILAAVQSHLGKYVTPQDDTTIIVIRALEYTPVEEPAPQVTAPASDRFQSMQPIVQTVQFKMEDEVISANISFTPESSQRLNVDLLLPSKLGYEMIARGAVASLAGQMGFSEDRVEDLKTAVAETCMNAIEHGNSEDPTTHVKVFMCVSRDSLEIRVTDRGNKRFPPQIPSPGSGDMRGWGLFFIQHLMDVFEVNHLPDGGNQIRLVMYLNSEQASVESA